MRNLTKSNPFWIGIGSGLLLFGALNLWVYAISGHPHGGMTLGFPLPVYVEQFTSPMDLKNPEANHFVNFYPFFLAVDIVWLFFSALILGLFGVGVANSIEKQRQTSNLK
jgi:hypothetical protein